jgi:cytochrome o ubiquinol oxidase subunit 2
MLKKLLGIGVPVIALIGVIVMMFVAAQGVSMPVIDTRGEIADAQRDTLYFAVITMLVIIIPVFLLAAFIPWRYRASNKRATYRPGWTSSKRLEVLWWGVPIIIVAILSVLTWHTSHSLDPYRPLKSSKQPIKVQVVAMQWKWLFIYPEENVASIGEFAMPTDTPVNFTITSDAPMNSFWIPQLGGQIYAMSGMSTKLHLNAHEPGEYRGVSANLSGEGHADMTFTARALTDDDYRGCLRAVTAAKQRDRGEIFPTDGCRSVRRSYRAL